MIKKYRAVVTNKHKQEIHRLPIICRNHRCHQITGKGRTRLFTSSAHLSRLRLPAIRKRDLFTDFANFDFILRRFVHVECVRNLKRLQSSAFAKWCFYGAGAYRRFPHWPHFSYAEVWRNQSESRQSQQRTGQRVEWVTFLNGSYVSRVDVRSPLIHVCLFERIHIWSWTNYTESWAVTDLIVTHCLPADNFYCSEPQTYIFYARCRTSYSRWIISCSDR